MRSSIGAALTRVAKVTITLIGPGVVAPSGVGEEETVISVDLVVIAVWSVPHAIQERPTWSIRTYRQIVFKAVVQVDEAQRIEETGVHVNLAER